MKWKEAGINRLSIGVQSLNDGVLKKLNRHQSAQDVYAALDMAQEYFENLSVDFILGLPEISRAEWQGLIKAAVATVSAGDCADLEGLVPKYCHHPVAPIPISSKPAIPAGSSDRIRR